MNSFIIIIIMFWKRNNFIIKEELMQHEPSQLLDIIGVVDIADILSSK